MIYEEYNNFFSLRLVAEGSIWLALRQTRALPSAALGKEPRHIPSRQRLLCRVPHVGHSAKDFPSATTALGKEKPPWRPGHGDGPFAECHASALGKEMCFLFF